MIQLICLDVRHFYYAKPFNLLHTKIQQNFWRVEELMIKIKLTISTIFALQSSTSSIINRAVFCMKINLKKNC